jgi:hypothetical protein
MNIVYLVFLSWIDLLFCNYYPINELHTFLSIDAYICHKNYPLISKPQNVTDHQDLKKRNNKR